MSGGADGRSSKSARSSRRAFNLALARARSFASMVSALANSTLGAGSWRAARHGRECKDKALALLGYAEAWRRPKLTRGKNGACKFGPVQGN